MDNYGVTNDFGYNLRSEVIEALMGTNTYGYAYDPIGNRLAATNNAEALSYLANELNQYTSISNGVTLEPSYDDDGNLVAYGDWTFTWNGENRLVEAARGKRVVTYAYDHTDRMFAKATYDAADLETPVSVLRHIWDGFNIVRSATLSNDVVTAVEYNVWGLDLSGSLQGAGGVGGLLAVTISTNSTASTFSTCLDANGNITEYVDATGAIVAHREYSPFGETTALSGPMQNAFAHWWSTKPWDPVTDLSEYQFRMYSPELGRWTSRDPIEERGGLNIFALNANNAVCEYDKYGLFAFTRYPGWDTKCPGSYVKDSALCGLWAKRVAWKYQNDLRSQISDEYGYDCPVQCKGDGLLSGLNVPTEAHLVIEAKISTTKSLYTGKLIYGISSKSISCNMLTVCIDCCGREYNFNDIDTQVLDPTDPKDGAVAIVVNFVDVPGLSMNQIIEKAGGIQ